MHLTRWWPEIARTAYRADLDYSVAGLLREMDRHGIAHAVVLQMFLAPSAGAAMDEGRALHAESGGRLVPVATIDPTGSKTTIAAVIERLEREPHLRGLKLYPGYRGFYPHDPRLDPVYELARRREWPVLLHQGDTLDGLGLLKFARPIEVDEVAGRFRDVRFVLCHLGNPWIDEAMEIVYKNPNVYADTSGLLPHPSRPYFAHAVERVREVLYSAVVAAGAPDRLLFGSDWPLEELGRAVGRIESLPIPADGIAAILGGNAARLFRIPPRPRGRVPPNRAPGVQSSRRRRRRRGSAPSAGGPRPNRRGRSFPYRPELG